MRIKYQIFLTLLAASALLVLAMYAISSWSFNRGFVEYVNQNEISRLSPIAESLVYEYEQNGSWDWVDESDLRQFSRPGRDNRGGQNARQRLNLDGTGQRPPPARQAGDNGPRQKAPRGRRPGPKLVLVDVNKKPLVIRSSLIWAFRKASVLIDTSIKYLLTNKRKRLAGQL